MKFISANTARAMVKEYEDSAQTRFLNELNEKITTAAKSGARQVRILLDTPEKEKTNLCIYLATLGYAVEPIARPGASTNIYKVMW